MLRYLLVLKNHNIFVKKRTAYITGIHNKRSGSKARTRHLNHLNSSAKFLYACQVRKVDVGLAFYVFPTYMFSNPDQLPIQGHHIKVVKRRRKKIKPHLGTFIYV